MNELFTEAQKEWSELADDFKEFSQGPSDFQIEVFMTRSEGPPEVLPVHAYRHMLAQIKPAISEMRRMSIEHERILMKLEDLRKDLSMVPETEPRDRRLLELSIMEAEFALEENELAIDGKRRQIATMKRILNWVKKNARGPLTNERLQSEEWLYWTIRLARQAVTSREGAQSGIGTGNLNSLLNAMDGSPLDDSPHRIPKIPQDFEGLRALASGDLKVIEQLKLLPRG